MRLGAWASGDDPDYPREGSAGGRGLTEQLEHAAMVLPAVTAVGGCVGRRCGSRAPTFDARMVGTFVMRDVTTLVGMSRGRRRELGSCVVNGALVRFQYWWPHLGVAMDLAMPSGGVAEVEAKAAWCEARTVLYFAPDDVAWIEKGVVKTETLMSLVQARRQAVAA